METNVSSSTSVEAVMKGRVHRSRHRGNHVVGVLNLVDKVHLQRGWKR